MPYSIKRLFQSNSRCASPSVPPCFLAEPTKCGVLNTSSIVVVLDMIFAACLTRDSGESARSRCKMFQHQLKSALTGPFAPSCSIRTNRMQHDVRSDRNREAFVRSPRDSNRFPFLRAWKTQQSSSSTTGIKSLPGATRRCNKKFRTPYSRSSTT